MKKLVMKKLFAVLAVAAIVTACNDSGSSTDNESTITTPVVVDTNATSPMDTTANGTLDTTNRQ